MAGKYCRKSSRGRKLAITLGMLLFLGALGLTVYPVVSNRYNRLHQSKLHTEYRQAIQTAEDSSLARCREQAQHYNERLQDIADAAGSFSPDTMAAAEKDYVNLLDPTGSGIMGYVRIPKLDVALPIYHGTGADTLELGAGHLVGSALPVGGAGCHSVITGHSGLASQKMFSDLPELQTGDLFFLDVLGQTLAYRVDQLRVVLPSSTRDLEPEAGKDLCTLVTCTPFGINTHRLLVRGSRIAYTEQAEKEGTPASETAKVHSAWEQEYIRGLFLGLIGAALVLSIFGVFYVWGKRHG